MLMCPKCNFEVEADARFCPNCGVPFIVDDGSGSEETTVSTSDMNPLNRQNYENPAQQQPFSQAQPGQYANPAYQQQQFNQPTPPVGQLRTNRSFLKVLLLSCVTFGIYGIICYGHVTDDVNLVCSRYDGRKSMNYYLLMFLVGPITFEIATIVWMHNLCDRIGNELKRRQVDYKFGAGDFWLWGVLGSLILVGPFVFAHKLFKAVNKMNESFNAIG